MLAEDFHKTFCPRIWNELFIDRTGTIKPCCAYAGDIKSNNEPLNIATHSAEEISESPDWLELKRKALADEPIEGCKWTCYRNEAEGGNSLRLMAIKGLEWRTHSEERQLPSTRDARINAAIEVLEGEARCSVLHLQYGDACNLRCRMCNPLSSSRIAADPVQSGFLVSQIPKYKQLNRTKPKDRWFSDQGALREKLIGLARKARLLNISAGEPFINPRVLKLLQHLCETNLAPNLKLLVTTNGTLSTRKIMEQLMNFEEVRLVVSVDGVGPVNDYIRDGSDWHDILKSLDRFANADFLTTLSPTVQIYNLFDLPKIASLGMERGIKLSSGWVNSPTFLNPLKLPLTTRVAICNHLEAQIRTLGLYGQYEGFIRQTIGRLCASGPIRDNKKIMETFFRYTTALDKSRQQSFEDAAPDLARLINPSAIWEAFEQDNRHSLNTSQSMSKPQQTPQEDHQFSLSGAKEANLTSKHSETKKFAAELSTISDLRDQNIRLKRLLTDALIELDRLKR